MFTRLLFLILTFALIGAVLLDLRQRRIDAMHDMALLHKNMRQQREALWQNQFHIAERVRPDELTDAIERAGLDLEPINPAEVQDAWQTQTTPMSPDQQFSPGQPRLTAGGQ